MTVIFIMSMDEIDLQEDTTPCCRPTELDISGHNRGGCVDEGLDPRIQIELERLNTSTDTINKLEVDLDEARMAFRQLLVESTHRFDALTRKLGKCVEQARPYYCARIKAKQALVDAQVAAVRYERAMSQHAAAREMVYLAEEGLMQKGCTFDSTWQEMLNHATSKVNSAEKEKLESAANHKLKSSTYHDSENRVKVLQKELKRAIAKSSMSARRSLLQINNIARMHQLQLLPYFELKAAMNQQLETQKMCIKHLEENIATAKVTYASALSNLEMISDEIHQTRSEEMEMSGIGTDNASGHLPFTDDLQSPSLHLYHSSTLRDSEYKALPLVLGTRASPTLARDIIGCIKMDKTELQHESSQSLSAPQKDTSAEESTNDDADVNFVTTRNVDLPGWQVVAFDKVSSSSFLSADDRESVVSDTESLASIEMLSDEAIAGLMLEEQFCESVPQQSSSGHESLGRSASSGLLGDSTPLVAPQLAASHSEPHLEGARGAVHVVDPPARSLCDPRHEDSQAFISEVARVSDSLLRMTLDANAIGGATRPTSLPLGSEGVTAGSPGGDPGAGRQSSESEPSSSEAVTPAYAIFHNFVESPPETPSGGATS